MGKKQILNLLGISGALLIFPGMVLADGETALNGADTAWILTSTALVLFMTLPGLALFYGGLLAGVFSSVSLGVFSGYGYADGIGSMGGQIYVQLIGIFATVAFTAVVTWGLLKTVDALVGLRVSEEQEIEGLDLVLHEERGYNL